MSPSWMALLSLTMLQGLRGMEATGPAANMTQSARVDVAENHTEAPAPMDPQGFFIEGQGILLVNSSGAVYMAGSQDVDVSLGSCPSSDNVKDPSLSCASAVNSGCEGCQLYNSCKGHSMCILYGFMVVPGSPLRGMEDISSGTAGAWDFLWPIARSHCGSNCVLLTNPVNHREQHQMHVHFRQYQSGGAALKSRLEQALCGTSGWLPFGQCSNAKARLYDRMPGVFSAVAAAYGGGSLANIGISVWFTSACGGGQQVILLATSGCSLVGSIGGR